MENNEAAFQSTRNGPEQLHQEIDENIAPSMFASILNQQFGSDLSTIPETEEEDAYTLAFPGEYDQLGNISKRHMNWNKGADNIYSHTLFASDPNDMYDTARHDIPVIHDDGDDDFSHVSTFGAFSHIEGAYDTAVYQKAVPEVKSDNSYSHVQLTPQTDA